MLSVIIYVNQGEIVAICPPDEEPMNGSFGTWYGGRGESYEEALQEARNAFEGLEELEMALERSLYPVAH